MSTPEGRRWVRVKKGSPCRYCRTADERCAVSADGRFAICYRIEDGAAKKKADTHGNPYWIHRLTTDPQPAARPRRKRATAPSTPGPQRADPDTLDRVYTALLAYGDLALTDEDRAELARRGFPEGEPERRSYRRHTKLFRTKIAEELAKRFGRDVVLGVPGFVVNNRGVLTLAGGAGLLIPTRDVEGRIVALSLRPRTRAEGRGKYYWITSKATEQREWDGPSPGAPVHVPMRIERPAKLVRVTEGALKADLAQILSGLPTIGVPGVGNWQGALQVLKALVAETVRVAYDADWRDNPKVSRALHDFARALQAAGFAIEVELWNLADGKGIDDLLAGGKTPMVLSGHDAEGLIDDIERDLPGAPPTVQPGGHNGGTDNSTETQAQILLRLAADATLFHTEDGRTFASVPVGEHVEHHPIRSTSFKRWLVHKFFLEQRKPPSSESLQGVLGVLESRAQFDGLQESVFVRVAGTNDADNPKHYLDLCDDRWRAVEITRDGWRIIDRPPVKFRRVKGMLPLPIPERGGSVNDLRPFLNVGSEEDWRLVVVKLTADLRPDGPYPIQAIHGEQGSAKSTTCRVLRRTIDPHVTLLRCEPKEARDLMIAATNAWVVSYDNLSNLTPWLSDALCRLATGGGYGTRMLYENDEEVFFDAMRPVLINGIEDLASRFDLLDRCIVLHLPMIPDEKRKEEAGFWRDFAAAHPRILGALLDAAVGGLRELSDVKLDRLPRMADFARWGEAVGRALGWPKGAFLEAYEANRTEANDQAIESSPVAVAVRTLMESESQWEGTATALRKRLGEVAGEDATKQKTWPKTPRGMTGALQRVAPALRRLGILSQFGGRKPGSKRTRFIAIYNSVLVELGEGPSRQSQPSRPALEADGARDGCAPYPNDNRPGNRPGGTEAPNEGNPSAQSDLQSVCNEAGDDRDGRDGPSPILPGRPAAGRERGRL
jgi:hypothetical protein